MVTASPTLGRHGRIDVAEPLEMYAVTLHGAGLGDGHQQQVEIVEAVRHARQPSFA